MKYYFSKKKFLNKTWLWNASKAGLKSDSENIMLIKNKISKQSNSKTMTQDNVNTSVVIVTPVLADFAIEESQITYENVDYMNRRPYHHSSSYENRSESFKWFDVEF